VIDLPNQPTYPSMKVFTGTVPFSGVRASEVVIRITNGKRPGRPNHPEFSNPLWTLTTRCWAEAAKDRPNIEEVVKEFKELSVSYSFARRTLRS
jgi:hypothetical protein